eukprot:scaffold1026_cov409-Prasinococcus_capsulatus_cf.AAC.28
MCVGDCVRASALTAPAVEAGWAPLQVFADRGSGLGDGALQDVNARHLGLAAPGIGAMHAPCQQGSAEMFATVTLRTSPYWFPQLGNMPNVLI